MSLKNRATTIPLAFLLFGLLILAGLYWSLSKSAQDQLRMESLTTAEQVRLRLEAWVDSRASLVVHMADQQFNDTADLTENFPYQAATLVGLYPGFQALNFIDRQWTIRIIVPRRSNAPALNSNLHNHPSDGVVAALEKASTQRGVFRTPVIDLLQGGKGIALYSSMYDRAGDWIGFANGVFKVQQLVDSCLYEAGLRDHFSYRLTDQSGAVAYAWEKESAPANGTYQVEMPVRIVDKNWLLTLSPTPDHVAKSLTSADEFLTALGVLLLGGLALALRLLLLRQAALSASQAKYRLLVENQVDMVVKLDPRGNLLYVSPSFCATYGRSEASLLDTAFISLVHDNDKSTAQSALKKVSQPPHKSFGEWRSPTDNGLAWQTWTNVAVLDEQGEIAAITCLGHDLTRRRELEDQLAQSRKMQAVGQLAGGIAHDFNNLLQAILGHLQLVVADLKPVGQTAADLNEIETAVGRAMQLTQRLLAVGRRQTPQTAALDLNEVLTEALQLVRRRLPATIRLNAQNSARPVTVLADRGQIEQSIQNICDNARSAIEDQGQIECRVETCTVDEEFCLAHPEMSPGDYGVVVIRDNGHGMTEAVRERAFEPFFTTRAVGKGAGLGLAVSYSIVRQHQGTITIASQPQEGAELTIFLPLARADQKVPPVAPTPTIARKQVTILLAEDNEAVRKLAIRVLERADYKTLVAHDGQEAVALFKEHADEVDLLILDQIMPRMGGREAGRAIRTLRPDVPVLFASGYDPHTMADAEPLPAGAHTLAKPYGVQDLLQKVRSILADQTATNTSA